MFVFQKNYKVFIFIALELAGDKRRGKTDKLGVEELP